MTQAEGGYTLAHPLYLDVPMMVSFLAYLQGGVTWTEEEARRSADTNEASGKMSGGFKFPLAALFGMDLRAEAAAATTRDASIESTATRHHTVASLFNALYQYLHEDDQVISLSDASQLASLRPGQLVEVTGEYLGNPLAAVLDMLQQLLPYVEENEEADSDTPSSPPRSIPRAKRKGGPRTPPRMPDTEEITQQFVQAAVQSLQETQAKAQEQGKRAMKRMAEDMRLAPVHDLLIRVNDQLRAVLTVSSDFYSDTTSEYLRAGEFTALGKVTRVLREDQVINLTRRTVLGVAGEKVVQELMGHVNNAEEFDLKVEDPIIKAPAVQILPMAIFI